MKFTFLGTRGSYPISKKGNKKYGGSTPCVEIIDKKERLIIDAGTGILNIDFDFYFKASRIDILLTHLHMDHIQGLGFFKPLFIPGKEIHIWGPAGINSTLQSRLNRFLSPPIFPLPLRDIPSNLIIHEIGNSNFSIGTFNITSEFVIHPGPTVGYRIEKDGRSLVYIPDHEPMIGSLKLFKENKWISGFDLANNADILIHDNQYSDQEYMIKIGWGHSSSSHVIEFAEKTNIKKLFMFHHDPEHSDVILNNILAHAKSQITGNLKVKLASQGKTYTVK